jgi:hypothetical protein
MSFPIQLAGQQAIVLLEHPTEEADGAVFSGHFLHAH